MGSGSRASGGGLGQELKTKGSENGKGVAVVIKETEGSSFNGGYSKEERERGGFRILESASNFPLLFHGEDGRLTLDKRAPFLKQRERGLERCPMIEEEEAMESERDALGDRISGLKRVFWVEFIGPVWAK